MEIIIVKTKEQLKELYDSSAMTWEGLRSDDFEIALQECGQAGAKGYPDDLNIFSIKDFQGLAIQYGARWIDDVIDNNARREKYHPFGGSHYGN